MNTQGQEDTMLKDHDAMATIAVRDLAAAREFYEKTLGFSATHEDEPGVAGYKSGNSFVLVYESRYAGTNQATTAAWAVSNVDELVKELKAKGITFEHYDLPGTTREGDIHVSGATRVAWFKDPDGNILSIVNAGRS